MITTLLVSNPIVESMKQQLYDHSQNTSVSDPSQGASLNSPSVAVSHSLPHTDSGISSALHGVWNQPPGLLRMSSQFSGDSASKTRCLL